MTELLVTIDAVAGCDDAFLQRLAIETGRPPNQWERDLRAPRLCRALFVVGSEDEGRAWAERLGEAGLVCSLVRQPDAVAGMRGALEAIKLERRGASLAALARDGTELVLAPRDLASITTGQQRARGDAETFVVLGLRCEPSAVVLRTPGCDVSDVAPSPAALLEALMGFGPDVIVERGLDGPEASPPLLDALQTDDLAHLATLSAWLKRQNRKRSDAPAALPSTTPQATAPEASAPRPQGRSWSGGGVSAVVGLAVAAFVLATAINWPSAPPAEASVTLSMGETWKSPYGATFTLRHAIDPGTGLVSRGQQAVEVRRGDERHLVEIHRGQSPEHIAFGLPFRVTLDATVLQPTSARIDVRPPLAVASPGGAAPDAIPAVVVESEPLPLPDGFPTPVAAPLRVAQDVVTSATPPAEPPRVEAVQKRSTRIELKRERTRHKRDGRRKR